MGIMSVYFDVRDQLLIICSAFVKHVLEKRGGLQLGSASGISDFRKA